eukprot:s3155_g1.t1
MTSGINSSPQLPAIQPSIALHLEAWKCVYALSCRLLEKQHASANSFVTTKRTGLRTSDSGDEKRELCTALAYRAYVVFVHINSTERVSQQHCDWKYGLTDFETSTDLAHPSSHLALQVALRQQLIAGFGLWSWRSWELGEVRKLGSFIA